MRDLEARAVLTPAALPSALMHTLVNTHRMLNCAAFSGDAACVAGERPRGGGRAAGFG